MQKHNLQTYLWNIYTHYVERLRCKAYLLIMETRVNPYSPNFKIIGKTGNN